jgi:hypothetical protein
MASEPITREEVFLNSVATGEATNIEPITREEMFLAKLGGADVTTPTPITRKERFLQKAIASGGGGGSGGGGSTDEGWIGDGNTHIWISLHEGRTSPMLGVCPNGTVTVDWGDGTTPDVLTGPSTTTDKYTPNHEYAKAGDYVITLTVDGEMGFFGLSSQDQYSGILRYSRIADSRNRAYQNAVQKVEIGEGVTSINGYAFFNCNSLESVSVPEGVTSIGASAFQTCSCLTSVTMPDGVTSVATNAFKNCYSIASVVIPDGAISIDAYAFHNCYGVRYYDFTSCESVPTLISTSAFSGISADCEIRVPAALYDEWVAATNWTTYASYIKAV